MSESVESAGDLSAERVRIVARFEESGLATDRFVPVIDGKKASPVDHSIPNNRSDTSDAIGGNYGIYAGNGIAIFDVDDYGDGIDPDALNAVLELPDTLTVASPHTDGEGGGHRFYRIVPGEQFGTAPEACRAVWNGRENPNTSWGELRAQNQYVVGPGSQLDGCDKEWCGDCAEPDGGFYRIASYRPIAAITADRLADVLRQDPNRPEDSCNGHSGASGSGNREHSTVAVDVDRETVATVDRYLEDLQTAAATTRRTIDRYRGFTQGNYRLLGFEADDGSADHSNAEAFFCSRVYGAVRWATDGRIDRERAERLIYAYVSDACRTDPVVDDGDRRKWLRRDDDYRSGRIGWAIHTFQPQLWDRWRKKVANPYRYTGEYGEPLFEYVLRAVWNAYESGNGYPTKDPILSHSAAHTDRSRGAMANVLGELKNERSQVKLAFCPTRRNGERYVWYPASEPDPPDARWVEHGSSREYR